MSPLPILFDTSIYIPHLRGQAYSTLSKRAVRTGRVRLSAVVLAELYAGTRSAADAALRAYRESSAMRIATEPPAQPPRPKRTTASAYGAGRSRPTRCPAFSIMCSRAPGIFSAKMRA